MLFLFTYRHVEEFINHLRSKRKQSSIDNKFIFKIICKINNNIL